jgi:DNA-directed RNA polymerase subunit K/omega
LRKEDQLERAPKQNRFEFVVVAGQRARQLLAGAAPRADGDKKITIAQREVLRRKVERVEESK